MPGASRRHYRSCRVSRRGKAAQSSTATALTWGFAASEPSTFECRLYLTATGPGAFGPCTTGASHSVAGLAPGSYTFEVGQ